MGWRRGTLRRQGGAVLHWDRGGTQSGRGIGWRFNCLLAWQRWLSNGWWRVKKPFERTWPGLAMGFVGCWVKGLGLMGNLLVAWNVWPCGYWQIPMGMWWRDFEGGMVAGFVVVEKYGECLLFFSFFFFGFWIDLQWCFKQIGVCSDTKTNTGQPKQN